MDIKQIRINTISLLSKDKIIIPEHLPLLEEDACVRSENETINRLLCLNVLAACSYGFGRERAKKWLKTESLESLLTDPERDFLDTGQGNPEKFQVQIEGMWALFCLLV